MQPILKIAVIGMGFVGLTFASFLGTKGIRVTGVEADKKRYNLLKKRTVPFYEPNLNKYLKECFKKKNLCFQQRITNEILENDFIFLTIGTPIGSDGRIDLSYIKSAVNDIASLISSSKKYCTIVIKSTVIPQTATNIIKPILISSSLKESVDFDVLSNPEFLREGFAMQDTVNPHVIVIGGLEKPAKRLAAFYDKIYPNHPNVIITNNSTAELIKYANNAFLATKISFINSISNLCQRIHGSNVDDIAKAIGIDPRIGNLYLKAGPGYGGSCFPKDLQALISFASDIGYNPIMFNAVKETNNMQIEEIINLLKNHLIDLKKKRIGILGLAFKENTDDIRESVSIKLINILLEKNVSIIVHDPKAIENTRLIFRNRIEYASNISDVFDNTDCVILLTPWEEYNKLDEKLFCKMRNPLIIDTRRVLKIHNKRIKYVGLGIGLV
jgi:UDPglucose 6-dehydrogenase